MRGYQVLKNIGFVEMLALEKTFFLVTLQGFRPPLWCPCRDNAILPGSDFSFNTEESYTAPPPVGAGMAQEGGFRFFKKDFHRTNLRFVEIPTLFFSTLFLGYSTGTASAPAAGGSLGG